MTYEAFRDIIYMIAQVGVFKLILGYRKAIFAFRKGEAMVVTKSSIIGDVLDFDSNTAKFFFEIGMHCLGCPSARGESIEDACMVHGTDADALVAKINEYLNSKN